MALMSVDGQKEACKWFLAQDETQVMLVKAVMMDPLQIR